MDDRARGVSRVNTSVRVGFMVRILACLLAALATTLCRVPLGIGETPVPDVVLVNGRLFTGDGSRPYVEALAIRGDRIVAVGTSANIGSLAGPMTTRIDVGGRVVIPGFNDAHYHLRIEPPLFPLPFKSRDPQWDEVKATVVSAVLQAPKGMLIKGETGSALLDDPRVTRAALDELAPEHPVILSTWTGHSAILNSAAFKMLGVQENEPDPIGGRYVRASNGTLTGLVLEFAQFRLHRRLSELASDEKALEETRRFLSQAMQYGITSVQLMSIPPSPERCLASGVITQVPRQVVPTTFSALLVPQGSAKTLPIAPKTQNNPFAGA